MTSWSNQIEEDLTLLIKDWLKQNGKTQADLKESLQLDSSRMPVLLESLKKEFLKGGISKVAAKLCKIEESWLIKNNSPSISKTESDPYGQLDFLLQEMKEDCNG